MCNVSFPFFPLQEVLNSFQILEVNFEVIARRKMAVHYISVALMKLCNPLLTSELIFLGAHVNRIRQLSRYPAMWNGNSS